MANPYIEEEGAEFPINNCVHCGQTEYVASFGEDTVQNNKLKAAVRRGPKSKFMPKVPARK